MKIAALGNMGIHWDGTNLKQRLEEEIADVLAACRFIKEKHRLDLDLIRGRAENKYDLYQRWDSSPN